MNTITNLTLKEKEIKTHLENGMDLIDAINYTFNTSIVTISQALDVLKKTVPEDFVNPESIKELKDQITPKQMIKREFYYTTDDGIQVECEKTCKTCRHRNNFVVDMCETCNNKSNYYADRHAIIESEDDEPETLDCSNCDGCAKSKVQQNMKFIRINGEDYLNVNSIRQIVKKGNMTSIETMDGGVYTIFKPIHQFIHELGIEVV